ncbi:MAG: transketolase [Bdellovibrionaceae bacterium]|nr:transketolase [Pseudobdellovibrionaceae bacterium]
MQPLSFSSGLAGNPTREPTYAVEIKGADGQPLKVADPKATRALVSLMDMNAVLGGAASHYGGPAAFAELMSALHGYVFWKSQKAGKAWHEMFNLVNDAGHCENGLYALKANYGFADLKIDDLKKFRSMESHLTGHGEAHLFPKGVQMSNGPLGSAFPQSQGLAMADHHAGNKRVTVTAISDGGCMEGEAREAMATVPGFARQGKLAPFVLIISDNNTKLTGRIDQESFSMTPTFAALETLGWKVVKLQDGHDLQKCFDTISAAIEEAIANPTVPIAIHAKTIKGIGTKKTAESSTGAHGFPLKSPTELPAFLEEILEGSTMPAEYMGWIEELKKFETDMKAKAVKPATPEEKIQVGVSTAMVNCRKKNLPVVSVTSDLPGSTGVAGFRKEFPKDSFDVGVAESNMISAAAGFSKAGFIPVVDTFAQFGVTKGALPLTMASLSLAPMICVFSHTGFQDAADGASHQALTYLSMTMGIPHLKVFTLSSSEEADALVTQAIEKFAADRQAGRTPDTTVFFLGRENFPKTYKAGLTYKLGEAQVLREDLKAKNILIVASGSMVPQALIASDELAKKQVGSIVLHASAHSHPDFAAIENALKKTGSMMVTVEDHQLIGGFGQRLVGELIDRKNAVRAKMLGVHGEFGQSAYNAIDLYQKHGIDSTAIVKAAQNLLG